MIGNLSLVVGSYLPAGTPAAAELDCGGLVYCSAGGTGMHMDGLPHVTRGLAEPPAVPGLL